MSSDRLTRLVAEIMLDESPLRKSLTGLRSSIGGLAGKVAGELGRKFSDAFNASLKIGIAGAIAGAIAAVKVASDAEEIRSKFATVFATMSDEGEAFAQSLSRSVGRSVIDIRKSMADFGALFAPLGFAEKDALKLSEQVAALAIDIASFSNSTDAEAGGAIMSALLGESEPIKRFGVVLNETKVAAELMAMGVKGAATDSQKTMARWNIIWRATAQAQGDAVRTSGSFANSWKALGGAVRDLAGDLGQAFVPAATATVQTLRDAAGQLSQYRDEIVEFGRTLGGSVGGAIAKIKDFIASHKDMISGIATSLPTLAGAAIAIKAVAAALSLSGFGLISPGGAIIAGLTLFGLAAIDAKVKGQTWADSVAEWTARLFGFKNAITATNEAVDAMNANMGRTDKVRQAKKSVTSESPSDDMWTALGKMEKARDEAKQARDELMKKAQAAVNEHMAKTKQAHGNAGPLFSQRWGIAELMAYLSSEGEMRQAEALTPQIEDTQTAISAYDREIAALKAKILARQLQEGETARQRRDLQIDKTNEGKLKTGESEAKQKLTDAMAGAQGIASGVREMAAAWWGGMREQWSKQTATAAPPEISAGPPQRNEFMGLADYARNMQSSIGGSPEMKTAKATEKHTADALPILKVIADAGKATVDAILKPKPAVAT